MLRGQQGGEEWERGGSEGGKEGRQWQGERNGRDKSGKI